MEENRSMMSESINEIATALCAFQAEVEQPELNKTNPYFKSRYVDLSGVLKAVLPVLSKNGLAVAQIMDGDNLVTILTHKSGQWMKGSCPIGAYKTQQDRGSAITYTKRYGLCAMLGIAADTDDDANSATDADKKNGFRRNAKAAVTDDLTGEALGDVSAIADMTGFKAVWKKWNDIAPDLCNRDGDFYKAMQAKRRQIEKTA